MLISKPRSPFPAPQFMTTTRLIWKLRKFGIRWSLQTKCVGGALNSWNKALLGGLPLAYIWMIVYSHKRYHIPCPHGWATSEVFITIVLETLQWRHNDPNSVSNHLQLDCLFSRLFRLTSKKHQSSISLAFVREIHRWPVDFLHKRPVTRKIFQYDDVIMKIGRVIMGPHFSMTSRCPWHTPLLWSRPLDIICAPSHQQPSRWLNCGYTITCITPHSHGASINKLLSGAVVYITMTS